MRHPRRAALVLAALSTVLTLAAPAQAAAPTVELQPHELARGADIAIPHIDEGDFVDGARRVELPGTVAELLGPSGEAWVVATHRTNRVGEWRNRRVLRVEADGTVREVLRDVDAATLRLSEDGSRLVGPTTSNRRTTVRVWSGADGSVIAERTFSGYPDVVTADARKVLVDTVDRLAVWRVGAGTVRTVTRKLTGQASFEHDLLTTYTKDPYLGGCTKLVRLSDLGDTVWRSCRDRVAAVSPDATRMVTFDILTDGLGPGEINLRTIGGRKLATYTTNWFSGWDWESPDTLLLTVNGRKQASVVRCTLGSCENAIDPVPVTAP
jgi:hypothetical protein